MWFGVLEWILTQCADAFNDQANDEETDHVSTVLVNFADESFLELSLHMVIGLSNDYNVQLDLLS